MSKKMLLLAGAIVAAAIAPIGAQSSMGAIPGSPETLIAITANNQMAWVLCVGKDPSRLEEVYFKGPASDKLRVSAPERGAFPGFVIEYTSIGPESTLKKFVAYEFMNKGLPVPVIYSFNGNLVPGLGDGGGREAELDAASLKEFEKLPSGFQQALKDFYLFCNGTTPGVSLLTEALGSLVENGLGLKPYPLDDEMIETDPACLKSIKREFGLATGN